MAATAISFIATTLFVFGVSQRLDVNCLIFFSSQDYLRVAVLWLTPLALFVLLSSLGRFIGGFIGDSVGDLMYGRRDPRERKGATPSLETRGRWHRLRAVLTLVFQPWFLLAVLGFVASDIRYLAWGVSAALLWVWTFLKYDQRNEQAIGNLAWFGLVIGPGLASFALFFGLHYGERALTTEPSSIIYIEGQPIEGHVVFALEDYLVVVRASDRKIVALSAETIEKLELIPK